MIDRPAVSLRVNSSAMKANWLKEEEKGEEKSEENIELSRYLLLGGRE